MSHTHFHPLRVRSVRPETQEATVVSFEVPPELAERFRFTQGQYLTLRRIVAGEELRRAYSICAGVADGELRVGVRRVRGGRFSNWLADHLRAGDILEVMPPQGRFFVPLEPAAARDYLGVAGGSGITPILSIMKTVLAAEPRSRFTLVYANRRAASTMFREELDDLKNRYMDRVSLHHVFSREQVDSPLNQGALDRAKLGRFLGGPIAADRIDHAFVCGPFAMNDEAQAALLAAGVAAGRIHVERFGLPAPADDAGRRAPPAAPAAAMRCRLTVVRDGIAHQVDYGHGHASLLEAATAAGLDLPYSCRSGVCGTCRAHLDAGAATMARNHALDRRDLDAGFILACQAQPASAQVRISFDHR